MCDVAADGTGAQREGGGLPALAAWLLVAIAAVGLLASTPTSAGPDEPAHEATAWYLSGSVEAGPAGWFFVPASLAVAPCFAHQTTATADCMPPPSAGQALVSISMVTNYQPPYYWVVGAGERLAALVGNEYADIGGRLASIALNMGALLLLSLYMRRRNRWCGTFLLLVSTPMAVFLGMVVNPSGWETTCAIAMAVTLAEAAWSRGPDQSKGWPRTETLVLVLACIGLSTARPLGFFWAAGLTVSAIVLAPTMQRRTLARVSAAVAPGILLGALWFITHPSFTSATTPPSPVTIPNLIESFVVSLLYFPEFLREMFGVLGWLDTPMPALLLFFNFAAWAVLLTRLPSIGKAAILCGVLGIVILPSAIEAVSWAALGHWWQGRYTLPFALGFVLLLLLKSGRLVPRIVSIVAGISVLSLGVMVWVNAVRYGFGLDSYGLPASLGTPGIGPVRLGISAALGLLLVLVGGYLLLRDLRTLLDARSRVKSG